MKYDLTSSFTTSDTPFIAVPVQDDGTPSPPCTDAAAGARVTAFLDEQLLLAAHLIDPERQQEYNQVVVISPGMDTRAYRWGHQEPHKQSRSILYHQACMQLRMLSM